MDRGLAKAGSWYDVVGVRAVAFPVGADLPHLLRRFWILRACGLAHLPGRLGAAQRV